MSKISPTAAPAKTLRLTLFAAIACIMAAVTACNDTGCLDNRSAIPYAGFYSYQTGQPITIDSVEIGGVGAPNDSLLMEAGDRYSNLYFPFRFEQNNTSFFIRYVSQDLNFPWLVDTISFTYTSTPIFVSESCGAMYYYHIESMRYTRNLIDSVALTDSLITNTDTERLQIFFRTSQPGDDDGVDDDGPSNGDDEPWEGDTSQDDDEDNGSNDEDGNNADQDNDVENDITNGDQEGEKS